MELNHLLYQLKLADQRSVKLFEQQLGISLTRYEILQLLLKEAPCSQVYLQDFLQIDQAAITRHLKHLEASGLIHRNRNPVNQRELIVSLTDKAQELLIVNLPSTHLSVKRQMDKLMSVEEVNQLSFLLDKLVKGLDNIIIEE